ncbi:tetratricopeptide repeat protein [Aequorivita sp. Q41]|uniref:tetratricopeptide repeat-containing sensor histidine kinase n=1 Tax=Aequorivita sp. Q41 TaxID=3153300 RepID=UPI0032428A2D
MRFTLKVFISIFCALFFLPHLQAQQAVIDSLKLELKLHPERDTTRVRMLNNLIYDLQEIDLKTAEAYIEESEYLIDSLSFTAGKAQLLYYKGYIDMLKSDFLKAIEHNNEAIALYKTQNNKRGISYSLNTIGNAYYGLGNFPKAIESYEKCIAIDEVRGDQRSVAYNIENIGSIYADQGYYDKAIINYNKSRIQKEKIKDSAGLVKLYANIGSIYAEKDDSPNAIENFNKALWIHSKMESKMESATIITYSNLASVYQVQERYDKAIEYYNKALSISEKVNQKQGVAISLNGIGTIKILQSKNQEALVLFKKTLEIYKIINDQKGIAVSLNNIGDIQYIFNNYDTALDYYKQALKISEDLDLPIDIGRSNLGIAKVYTQKKQYNKALEVALKVDEIGVTHQFIDTQRGAKELLTIIYENLGDTKKALNSYRHFKALNDSLFNKKNIKKITQLEYEYKYKQTLDSANIRELSLTKIVDSTSQDLEKSQRNSFIGIIVILLISILSGGFIFALKLRNANAVNQNIIVEQKLLRTQMTPHFIFNSLSVLQGMILNKEEKKSISYLSEFSKLLRNNLENSRHKMVALSDELATIDSYMALQNLDVDPPFNYSLTIDHQIDPASFKIPPMIIQPFVENAIEHAFVTKKDNKEIKVAIALKGKGLVCTIADNGIGASLEKPTKKRNKKSLATTITEERLKLMSKNYKVEGSISVQNRKEVGEQGTLVTLVIPYKIDTAV